MQHIGRDVHEQRDAEGSHCRHHDDHAQLALYGKVREPTNQ
jgi:hypothetical protein